VSTSNDGYHPFERGPLPVGVRTVAFHDAARDRRLTAEVWYPAEARYAGADTDPQRRDRYPLFPGFPEAYQTAVRDAAPDHELPARALAVFSHGFAGHRRQSTFFATHLASHGWVVVSADHTGNTFMDLAMGATAGAPPAGGLRDVWASSMEARPLDVRFLIDAAAAGELGVSVETRRVAMTGHSFGGWTTIRAIADEPRIAAGFAMAPAIGVTALRDQLRPGWGREVPTLVLAADRDSLLPLDAMREACAALPPPSRLVVLRDTDHMHFCDAAKQLHELFRAMPVKIVPIAVPLPPFAELAPAAHGHAAACGLGLAFVDAHIRGDARAAALLADPVAVLANRGVAAS
jgi:predicted dienelactone hydrolase